MARIRTVKPEFWSHPVMGKIDDSAKCLALALLNFSDDHGYFYSDPVAVRSWCRPFDEDSSITRRCLAILVDVGWIEVVESSTHGQVGRIVNFSTHQKVDRPKDSTIKDIFDSSNNRRIIDEQSSLERKGKEGNGREGKEQRAQGNLSDDEQKVVDYHKHICGPISPPPIASIRRWLEKGMTAADIIAAYDKVTTYDMRHRANMVARMIDDPKATAEGKGAESAAAARSFKQKMEDAGR